MVIDERDSQSTTWMVLVPLSDVLLYSPRPTEKVWYLSTNIGTYGRYLTNKGLGIWVMY